jgi:hypothetical protein
LCGSIPMITPIAVLLALVVTKRRGGHCYLEQGQTPFEPLLARHSTGTQAM